MHALIGKTVVVLPYSEINLQKAMLKDVAS